MLNDELCFFCGGSGEAIENRGRDEFPNYVFSSCTYCGGTGFRHHNRDYRGNVNAAKALEAAIKSLENALKPSF